MAAAVPVSFAEPSGQLYRAATLSATRRTLYSESDTVLHLAFPLGESAAGEAFFPTAIGRYGQPQSDFTAESEMFIDAHHGYNHGDYWSQPATIPQISAFFNIPTASTPAATSVAAHIMPPPNSLAQNSIAPRQLPMRPSLG